MHARALILATVIASAAQAQKLPPDGELPPPPDNHEHARALFQAQRYEQALAEFTELYREQQAPELLFEIARCQHALGRAVEAATAYRRYVVAQPDGPHAADANRALATLKPWLPPATNTPGLSIKMIRRPHRGLLIAGWSMFAPSYTAALISGLVFGPIFSVGPNSPNPAAGWTLLIPVAGPFISSIAFPNPGWAVPWSLADGLLQIAGFAMILAAYTHRETVPKLDITQDTKLSFAPWASRDACGLSAIARF
jgi:hypothetical protein